MKTMPHALVIPKPQTSAQLLLNVSVFDHSKPPQIALA
jgi:hypothetical protein